jgi:hypothetical protein
MNDPVRAAAEKILAAAATRQEAILVTRAVHAVKNGRPTDVALTDSGPHPRRKLAHVVGTVLWDPALDADAVVAEVTRSPRASRSTEPAAAA